MRPFVRDGYAKIREEYGQFTPPTPVSAGFDKQTDSSRSVSSQSSEVVGGHLALFNQHCQRNGQRVEWKYCDIPEGSRNTPVWTVETYVNDRCVARGKGSTKKLARMDAAREGLRFLGVVVCVNRSAIDAN
jgi:ribonuclease-3